MSADSLKAVTESLCFLSSSYKQLMMDSNSHEWAIYVSLITFFALGAGAVLQFKDQLQAIRKLKPRWWVFHAGGFFLGLVIVGAVLLAIIQRGNNKNQAMYLAAEKELITIVNKTGIVDTNSFNCRILTDNKTYSCAWWSHWGKCGMQIVVLVLFAGIAFYLLISTSKIPDKVPQEPQGPPESKSGES